MALNEEQLLLQVDILASKTDPATNPGMTYNSMGSRNKGLNPNYFTSNDTKIVNAINKTYALAEVADGNVLNALAKYNAILMDTSLEENAAFWASVQGKMGESTIIEALDNLYSGRDQQQILGLTTDDVGKILSIAIDESTGKVVTKAVAGGAGGPIDASDISYENTDLPEATNIKAALDYIVANGTTVDWGSIQNKPDIADNMVLTESELILKSGEKAVSVVPIVSDEDLDNIFGEM